MTKGTQYLPLPKHQLSFSQQNLPKWAVSRIAWARRYILSCKTARFYSGTEGSLLTLQCYNYFSHGGADTFGLRKYFSDLPTSFKHSSSSTTVYHFTDNESKPTNFLLNLSLLSTRKISEWWFGFFRPPQRQKDELSSTYNTVTLPTILPSPIFHK